MRRIRRLRSGLSYLRWLWDNRAEWRDRWNEENFPPLTDAEAIELLRAGNRLRSMIRSSRDA